jgi:hypothetical protein
MELPPLQSFEYSSKNFIDALTCDDIVHKELGYSPTKLTAEISIGTHEDIMRYKSFFIWLLKQKAQGNLKFTFISKRVFDFSPVMRKISIQIIKNIELRV